jgi:hypothetical protein
VCDNNHTFNHTLVRVIALAGFWDGTLRLDLIGW